MTLLCLTDVRFWNNGMGSLSRIAALISYLSRDWSIAVFFPGKLEDDELTQALARFPFLRLHHTGGFASAEAWERSEGLHTLEHALIAERPRVLLAEYYWVTRHLNACRRELTRGVLRVLDTHDAMHLRARAFRAERLPCPVGLTRAEERHYLDHYDWILAIQEDEAHVFSTMTTRPVHTVTHGQQVEPLPLRPDRHPFRLGLVSSAGASQSPATRWFLDEVWPYLQDARPDLELHVFGSVCDQLVDEYVPARVFIRGFVDDLRSAYAEIDAAINPTRFGTGICIKSIEALCYGRPLLSTPNGLSGMPTDAKEPFYRCQSVDDWLTAVDDLSGGAAEIEWRREQSIDYARRHFSPDAAFGRFAELLLAEAHEARPPSIRKPTRLPPQMLIRTQPHRRLVEERLARCTQRRFVLGTGPKTVLLRGCLPVDVVAHLTAADCSETTSVLGRPVAALGAVNLRFVDEVFVTEPLCATVLDQLTGAGVSVTVVDDLDNLVIFGTGSAARQALTAIGDHSGVVAFADNDATKQGSIWNGRRVLAPADLCHLQFGRIIVASLHHEEMCTQLIELGIRPSQISVFDPLRVPASDPPYMAAAIEHAGFYFELPPESVARLIAESLGAATVGVADLDPRTAAAGAIAFAMGCDLTLFGISARYRSSGRQHLRVLPRPWSPGDRVDLLLASSETPLPANARFRTAAVLDQSGRITWRRSDASRPGETAHVALRPAGRVVRPATSARPSSSFDASPAVPC